MTKLYDIAVVGAASIAGEALLALLNERNFPLGRIYLLDAGTGGEEDVEFKGESVTLQELDGFDFSQVQLAFFLTSELVSTEYVSHATQNGCVVIDTSRAFRYDEDVPLVIPEVNPESMDGFRQRDLIACPSSATVQLLMALKPIDDAVGIESIQVTALLAVSELGKAGQEELGRQTMSMLSFKDIEKGVFPAQIAFNLIPQCGPFESNGYSHEETDLILGAKKILSNGKINIQASAIQAPVFFGHSEVVHIQTREAVTADKIGEILDNTAGLVVADPSRPETYPTPVSSASGKDDVYVGRIREDLVAETGISLWIVADNIRRGIAINSVQIAEILVKDYL